MRIEPTSRKVGRQFIEAAHSLTEPPVSSRPEGITQIFGYGRSLMLGEWATGVYVHGRGVSDETDSRPPRLIVDFFADSNLLAEDVMICRGLQLPARTVYWSDYNGIIANRLADPAVMRNPIELLTTVLGCQALERGGVQQGALGRAPADEEISTVLDFVYNSDNSWAEYPEHPGSPARLHNR